MKIVIVYDSLYGNTEKTGRAVAESLRNGNEVTVLKASAAGMKDIEGADLIIVGSPTHGGQPMETVKRFLDGLPEKSLKGKKAASFDTCMKAEDQGVIVKRIVKLFGNAAPRIAKILADKGAEIVAAEPFAVTGKEGSLKESELERAQEWAAQLISLV